MNAPRLAQPNPRRSQSKDPSVYRPLALQARSGRRTVGVTLLPSSRSESHQSRRSRWTSHSHPNRSIESIIPGDPVDDADAYPANCAGGVLGIAMFGGGDVQQLRGPALHG